MQFATTQCQIHKKSKEMLFYSIKIMCTYFSWYQSFTKVMWHVKRSPDLQDHIYLDIIHHAMHELQESWCNCRDCCSLMVVFIGFSSIFESSGEKVPAAKPSGSYEGEGSQRWGEEQAFCLPCGGEESRPYSKVGREIQGIYRQLFGTFWTRRDLGKKLYAVIK